MVLARYHDEQLQDSSLLRPHGQFTGGTLLWGPGQTITVTAPGDVIPAINETFRAQDEITITSPIASFINRGQPLVTTWTGGTGTVHVTVDAVRGVLRSEFRCRFAASDQMGSVPSDVLATLPVGEAQEQVGGSEYRRIQTDASVSLEIAVHQNVRLNSTQIQ